MFQKLNFEFYFASIFIFKLLNSNTHLKLRGVSIEDFRRPMLIPCFLPKPIIDDAIDDELEDFFFPVLDRMEFQGLLAEPIESNFSLVLVRLSFDKRLDKDTFDDFGDASTMVIVWLCFVSLRWADEDSEERLVCIDEREETDRLTLKIEILVLRDPISTISFIWR